MQAVKQRLWLLGLLLLTGCAALPSQEYISPEENQTLRQSFRQMVVKQQNCHCCLDASAAIELSSVLFSGQMTGYLQAMSPSYLKFVGLGPLGQPLGVLTSTGQKFRYVAVSAATVYDGDVAGETFQDYAPEGLVPAYSYYWLIGRLQPGAMKLARVSRNGEGEGYWAELHYENKRKALVLFSPEQQVIQRHIVLDATGERTLNILYDNYSSGDCPLPGKVTITSLTMGSTLEVNLSDFRPQPSLSSQDFNNPAPPAFAVKNVE